MNGFNIYVLKYGQRTVNFRVKFSKRKTIEISVSPSAEVCVIAPEGIEKDRILKSVDSRLKWICEQIDIFQDYEIEDRLDNYKSGTRIRVLGREYLFKVIGIEEHQEEYLDNKGGSISLFIKDTKSQKRINLFVEEWFRNEAMIVLSKTIEKCFSILRKYGIPRPKFYLRKMKLRWGSCTPEGVLFLNPQLISLPLPLIEYAIMHEMCHLKHPDHSSEFYSFLDLVMPDWEMRENAVHDYGTYIGYS